MQPSVEPSCRPSLRHRLPVAAVAALVAIAASFASAALAAPCWSPPVTAAVTDPFREPVCRWCLGNRGLEYGTDAGESVRAVASGVVAFAGAVAGTRYVVVRHGDGLRVTYGNLSETRVSSGDVVGRGSLVGTTGGRLHLGVRDGERYVDPAPFIGALRGVVRLIPADGSPAAPAPPPRLRCAAG